MAPDGTPHATDLRGAIAIGLQEVFALLEDSLAGLSEADLLARPVTNEQSIAAIAMGILQHLDDHAIVCHGGASTFDHSERWAIGRRADDASDGGGHGGNGRFGEGPHSDALLPEPARDEVLALLAALRDAAEQVIDATSAGDLTAPVEATDIWPGSAAGAYLASIYHAMRQISRIWLIRGALGATIGLHKLRA
jgi:hypothetical protein